MGLKLFLIAIGLIICTLAGWGADAFLAWCGVSMWWRGVGAMFMFGTMANMFNAANRAPTEPGWPDMLEEPPLQPPAWPPRNADEASAYLDSRHHIDPSRTPPGGHNP